MHITRVLYIILFYKFITSLKIIIPQVNLHKTNTRDFILFFFLFKKLGADFQIFFYYFFVWFFFCWFCCCCVKKVQSSSI